MFTANPASTGRSKRQYGLANGYRAWCVDDPFADRIGRLELGKAADMVLIDWQKLTYPYQDDLLAPLDVIVHRARPDVIETVMIGGEIVCHKGVFTKVDKDAVLAEIASALKKPLTSAEEGRRHLAERLLPYVMAFYKGYLDSASVVPHSGYNSRQ